MDNIFLKLKNYRMKSLKFLLKLNLINHLKERFPRKKRSLPLTHFSAILKNSRRNLQLFIHDWNLMLMMNFLQKTLHWKSLMHLLSIFLLTLQLFHKKIPLQWCQLLFMIWFRIMIGFYRKKINLRKSHLPNISLSSLGKLKWFQKGICLLFFFKELWSAEFS